MHANTPGHYHTDVIQELDDRHLVHDCTDRVSLSARLRRAPVTFYCGIDPTADSLHVGSLLSLRAACLFAEYGHHPIVLVGGATGMIGDPSGRSQERQLLDDETLARNVSGLQAQINALLARRAGSNVTLVNNHDWFSSMTTVEFLRDIGKLANVTEMLARSSVKDRLANQGGLSFTEFSYQLLQAHDFCHLFTEHGCELQIGGSDQWGNIVAGTDMIRRRGSGPAFGLVWPLLLKADGQKFGKTAAGNVWLDPKRTSPYEFHQFWLNTDDADVDRLLRQFTRRPLQEIDELLVAHRAEPARRLAQRALADDVTSWVHGHSSLTDIQRAADVLFSRDPRPLDAEAATLLASTITSMSLSSEQAAGMPIEAIAHACGLSDSVSDARRTIKAGGMSCNHVRVTQPGTLVALDGHDWLLLAAGRRRHALVVITDPRL